jgi:hypothetical protein
MQEECKKGIRKRSDELKSFGRKRTLVGAIAVMRKGYGSEVVHSDGVDSKREHTCWMNC